jgi:hypothetical protein
MNLMKTTGVFAAALALVALGAAEAAAQAPALNVSANGRSVTIEWNALAGALGYNLQVGTSSGASNIASITVPASLTRIVVAAPPATYYLRVRGVTLTLQGPFSNEASVTVSDQARGPAPGPGPCQQPAAPEPSANVAGDGSVTISWNGVGGAIGYRVEFGRTAGNIDLVQNLPAHQTSFRQPIGVAGTFYARVIAGNACGTTASRTISFTVQGSPANPGFPRSGPRTPNPPPGRVLPLPSYGESVVQAMANAYRGDLENSCVEHGGNNVWLFRVVNALRQRDSRWGLNWKRGNRGDMSQDIVTYNYGSNPDEDTTDVYIIDAIGGHCGGGPDWAWFDQTGATRNGGGIGRWTLQPYLRAGFPADPRQ